jgi:hypothetical protein
LEPIVQRLSSKFALWFSIVGASLGVALSGCGTAEYRRLMADRGDKLRTGAAFRTLFGPSQIAGTPLKIRVPMVFGKSYIENSAHPQDGPKINPERVQPPFLPLPGFKLCYEGTGQDPQMGKVPFYCYLAAIESRPGEADKLAADLQAKLKEKFKETPDAWELCDAPAPDGKSLQWKKIRVVAEQPFLVRGAENKIVSKNLPGIFELWMYSTQDYTVLVGWRTPSSIEGPTPQSDVVVPIMVNPFQSTDAKPDFSTMPVLTAGTLTVEAAPPADAAN